MRQTFTNNNLLETLWKISSLQGDAPFPFKTEADQESVTYKESRSNSAGTVVVTTAQVHHPNQEVNLEQVRRQLDNYNLGLRLGFVDL